MNSHFCYSEYDGSAYGPRRPFRGLMAVQPLSCLDELLLFHRAPGNTRPACMCVCLLRACMYSTTSELLSWLPLLYVAYFHDNLDNYRDTIVSYCYVATGAFELLFSLHLAVSGSSR